MKSVAKFLAVSVALLFTYGASAGTLYWQVDDGTTDTMAAKLWVENTDTGVKEGLSDWIDAPTGLRQAEISSYTDSAYRFYVELFNYSDSSRQAGYKWGYGDLISSGYVAIDARSIPDARASAIALGNFANAPEPSSGLLLLMGGAILALRRRRQK